MKTELAMAGLRLDMRSRFRRRVLVVLVYAGLGALFTVSWYVDRWGLSAAWALIAGLLESRSLVGGFDYHGLVRPFNPAMAWRRSWPVPKGVERDCHNDERDIRFRDRAHYYSHRVLSFLFLIVWVMAFERRAFQDSHGPIGFVSAHYDILIYGFLLITIILSQTLPQALIVRHEPDIEPEE